MLYTVVLKNKVNFIVNAEDAIAHDGYLEFFGKDDEFIAIFMLDEVSYAAKKDVV